MRVPSLIAMDVDGTIAGGDHVLSERTLAVLRRLAEHAILGVLITGRTEKSTLSLAKACDFHAPQVSCNGALITEPDTGRRLWTKQMPLEQLRATLRAAEDSHTTPVLWTADRWFVEEPCQWSQFLATLLEEAPSLAPIESVIANEEVIKVMLGGEPAMLDVSILDQIPGMERSMPMFFETSAMGASKADALTYLLDHLGIDPSQTWGFGDGGNDVGWLSLVGHAFAPENARDQVRAIARTIVGDHRHDGVAEYLERFLIT